MISISLFNIGVLVYFKYYKHNKFPKIHSFLDKELTFTKQDIKKYNKELEYLKKNF